MRGINLKSKRVLVRLVVGVLAVVALLGFLVYPKGQDEAAATVAGYLHALADHDAAAALSYLSSSPPTKPGSPTRYWDEPLQTIR